jgi:ureidoacrylate peracid hydrolase
LSATVIINQRQHFSTTTKSEQENNSHTTAGIDVTARILTIKGYKLRPVLVAIDTQNGFVSDGGSYDKLGIDRSYYKKALPNVNTLVNMCRSNGIPVIFTLAIREPSGADLLTKTHKILPLPREERIEEVPICVRGTWDADIVEELKPADEKYVITKRRDSAFHGTALENMLRRMQVDTVIFCGFDTSMCVETSLRDAFNLGFDILVISDATASMNPRRYECTLDDVRSFYGLVLDTSEFASELS